MTARPIVFDVDGVLANFTLGFTQKAARIDRRVVVRSSEEQAEWDFHDFPSGVEAATWESVKRDPRFWAGLETHPGATPDVFDTINSLSFERPVYFATARVGINAHAQTVRWLFRHGIRRPAVVVTRRKGEFCSAVDAAAYIDDKAGNAVYVAYECQNTRSYLLNTLYNRFDHHVLGGKVIRVSSVSDFLKQVVNE